MPTVSSETPTRDGSRIKLLGLLVLATVTVSARSLAPSHAGSRADLVPILVGARGSQALVDQVVREQPLHTGSTIHQTEWTDTGMLVSVTTAGPRVVVLLDAHGSASVAHADGESTVHLAMPGIEPHPPYTVTVVQPRGRGGLLDARAVRVAALDPS